MALSTCYCTEVLCFGEDPLFRFVSLLHDVRTEHLWGNFIYGNCSWYWLLCFRFYSRWVRLSSCVLLGIAHDMLLAWESSLSMSTLIIFILTVDDLHALFQYCFLNLTNMLLNLYMIIVGLSELWEFELFIENWKMLNRDIWREKSFQISYEWDRIRFVTCKIQKAIASLHTGSGQVMGVGGCPFIARLWY